MFVFPQGMIIKHVPLDSQQGFSQHDRIIHGLFQRHKYLNKGLDGLGVYRRISHPSLAHATGGTTVICDAG